MINALLRRIKDAVDGGDLTTVTTETATNTTSIATILANVATLITQSAILQENDITQIKVLPAAADAVTATAIAGDWDDTAAVVAVLSADVGAVRIRPVALIVNALSSAVLEYEVDITFGAADTVVATIRIPKGGVGRHVIPSCSATVAINAKVGFKIRSEDGAADTADCAIEYIEVA